ncbi:MAG TPA: hypothetical protein DEP33_01645 [Alteromonas sp.]|jgi:hypothetical protein|nr:hypothetical protein [Alteromonas sp.]
MSSLMKIAAVYLIYRKCFATTINANYRSPPTGPDAKQTQTPHFAGFFIACLPIKGRFTMRGEDAQSALRVFYRQSTV